MDKGKIMKSLKYAIGEILLVVVGILIALQINNWNEDRLRDQEVLRINERLILDIDNDLRELYGKLTYYESQIPVFHKAMNDSVTLELFDEGYARLVTTGTATNLNKTGVQQLKALNINDDLSLRLVEIYDEMENSTIRPVEQDMRDRAMRMIQYYKTNFEWFPEWITTTITKDNSSKELQDFFLTSMRYRNEVSSTYQSITQLYIPFVRNYITELESIRTQLKLKTDEGFISISSESLDQYAGSYKFVKIEGEHFGAEIGDSVKLESFENFLRITDSSGFMGGLYLKENNVFYADLDGFEVTLRFEENNAGILVLEQGDMKGTHYFTSVSSQSNVEK